jgi:hypothetical protein
MNGLLLLGAEAAGRSAEERQCQALRLDQPRQWLPCQLVVCSTRFLHTTCLSYHITTCCFVTSGVGLLSGRELKMLEPALQLPPGGQGLLVKSDGQIVGNCGVLHEDSNKKSYFLALSANHGALFCFPLQPCWARTAGQKGCYRCQHRQ